LYDYVLDKVVNYHFLLNKDDHENKIGHFHPNENGR